MNTGNTSLTRQTEYEDNIKYYVPTLNTKSKYIWSMKEPLSYEQLTAKNLSDWTLLYKGTHKPNFRSRNYLLSWRQIYKKLNDAGLRLAKVIWLR